MSETTLATTASPANKAALNESTSKALTESLISPRFYTTDHAAVDRMSVASLQAEWDKLMTEFRNDNNNLHFKRPDGIEVDVNDIPPEVRAEFFDFLISSITSEFSGCVLYAELRRKLKNPDLRELFAFMARDESRHAGFINEWLRDFGMKVDLGLLTRAKKYTFFRPKFIMYATYLSEKIGYARYITIFRQIERDPSLRFHPIFKWFKEWCNDEFRHGEAFALLMRANPSLLRGINLYWIRFFTLAVFATMYVRDHMRPAMHDALGLPATEYDRTVFRITSDITRQVFPVTLDIDHPRFLAGLEALRRIATEHTDAKARGGVLGWLRRAGCAARGVLCFARLYFLPVKRHDLPADVRLAPTW